jgi:hypothetical protein
MMLFDPPWAADPACYNQAAAVQQADHGNAFGFHYLVPQQLKGELALVQSCLFL